MNDSSVHAAAPVPSRATGARRRATAGLLTVLLLAGCSGTAEEGTAIATEPERVRADVPTISEAAAPKPPTTTTPAPATDDVATPTSSPSAAADVGAFADEGVPEDLPRALVPLFRLDRIVKQDPDAAGERGEDLLRELQRVLDRPEHRRIDRAGDRVQRWLDDGDLDPEVAAAALEALEQAEGAVSEPDSDDDDDDEDDD